MSNGRRVVFAFKLTSSRFKRELCPLATAFLGPISWYGPLVFFHAVSAEVRTIHPSGSRQRTTLAKKSFTALHFVALNQVSGSSRIPKLKIKRPEFLERDSFSQQMVNTIDGELTPEEKELVRAIAQDDGVEDRTRRRAQAVITFLDTGSFKQAASTSQFSLQTVKKIVASFQEKGWQSLISIPFPEGRGLSGQV